MNLGNILALHFRGRPLNQTQSRWKDVCMTVLAKLKVQEDDASKIDLQMS